MSKKYITDNIKIDGQLLDGSGSAGTSGQVLSSTGSATSWVSGSGLPGGPYLPLAGGTLTGDLTVSGDLIVSGSETILNTETVQVEDNIIQLNRTPGSPDTATAATSGITIYRGNGVTEASLIFDDADDTWDLTNNLAVAGDLTSGKIVATASGTNVHRLINASTNSTVLQLTTTGDNPDLTLNFQTDHIFNSGSALHIQNDGQPLYLRGSQTTVGTTSAQSGYELTVHNGPGSSIYSVGNSTFAGDVTVNGGDVTIAKQNDAPTMTLLHDGTNPSTNDLLFKMQFQSDYNGSHQNWGKIEVDTNASSVRTNMDFYVKSTSGNEELALRLEGQPSAVPNAIFAGNVTLNSRLTFDYGGDHYFEAGTNSLSYKSSGGTSVMTLNASTQAATFAGDVTLSAGNIIFGSQYGVRFNDANTRIYTNVETPEDLIVEADQDLLLQPDGNVGIKTTSPAYPLDVSGTVKASALRVSASDPGVQFEDSAGSTYEGLLRYRNNALEWLWGGGIKLRVSSDGGMAISQGYSTSSIPTSGLILPGNVGIGTDSPTGKFNSYISAARQLTHNGNGGDLSIISDNNSSPVFYVKGTGTADLVNVYDNTNEVFTIKDGGNVGIGTTSPNHKLDIYSNENVPLRIHRPSNANLDSSGAWGIGFSTRSDAATSTTDTRAGIFSYYNGDLFLAANNSSIVSDPDAYARLTVLSTGNVGIGTISPKQLFHVHGGSTSGSVTKAVIGGTGGNGESYLYLAEHFSGDNVNYGFSFVADGNSSNNLLIKRHSNSTSGNTVITVNRDNDNVTFAGDVGIGVSPSQPLDVNGTALIRNTIYVGDDIQHWGDGGTGMYFGTDTISLKNDGGSTRLFVKSGGNVGIGTTNPLEELHITSTNPGVRLQDSDGTNTFGRVHFTGSTLQYFSRNNTSNGAHSWFGSNGTTNTEFMRLKNDGELRLLEYGSGTFTGTATQRLGVDSSGNVIEIPIGSGAIDGSGAAGQVTFWTDADTISGENNLYWDSTNDRLGIGMNSPNEKLEIGLNSSSGTQSKIRLNYWDGVENINQLWVNGAGSIDVSANTSNNGTFSIRGYNNSSFTTYALWSGGSSTLGRMQLPQYGSGSFTGTATKMLAVTAAGIVVEETLPSGGDITGVTAGTGLSGGGSSGTVTLNLDLGELTVGGTLVATDYLIAENGGSDNRQLISDIPLSIFNNDAGWTSNSGDITSVTAGTNLNGGGTSGAVTLNLDSAIDLTSVTTDELSYTYPTATDQFHGEIVTFGTFVTGINNGNIQQGDIIVYTTAGTNTGWFRAQGNTTYGKKMLGIAMGSSPSDGILIKGFARDTHFSTSGDGDVLYLSASSAGDATDSPPGSTNNIVRIIGYMIDDSTDTIFFDPDKSWVQVS